MFRLVFTVIWKKLKSSQYLLEERKLDSIQEVIILRL